jgi:hypothetical protein
VGADHSPTQVIEQGSIRGLSMDRADDTVKNYHGKTRVKQRTGSQKQFSHVLVIIERPKNTI